MGFKRVYNELDEVMNRKSTLVSTAFQGERAVTVSPFKALRGEDTWEPCTERECQ